MSSELTYDDFLDRLSIQEVLVDAGYHLNKRDGLRYPSYVRTDSEGRRVRGDKFIVTQNGKCCFQPPQQKVYNVISFIKEHPEMFSENKVGMSPDRLVNLVCNRLLNQPIEDRPSKITEPRKDGKPFNLNDYDIHKFNPQDRETQKRFYPYFKFRGIDLYTQYAFIGISVWLLSIGRMDLPLPTLPFRLYCPRHPTRLWALRNEDDRRWTVAAVTRARQKEATAVKDCGLPTSRASRWIKQAKLYGLRVPTMPWQSIR